MFAALHVNVDERKSGISKKPCLYSGPFLGNLPNSLTFILTHICMISAHSIFLDFLWHIVYYGK